MSEKERFKPEFKFDPSGASEQQQIKPRLAVIDQFYPEHKEDLQERELHAVQSRRDVDQMLKDSPLRLTFAVPDRLNKPADGRTQELQAEVTISSLKDFTPPGLVQRIRESKGDSNVEMRTALQVADAAKLVRAKLAAGNKKDLLFIQDVIKEAAKKISKAETPQSQNLRKQIAERTNPSLLDIVRPPQTSSDE